MPSDELVVHGIAKENLYQAEDLMDAALISAFHSYSATAWSTLRAHAPS